MAKAATASKAATRNKPAKRATRAASPAAPDDADQIDAAAVLARWQLTRSSRLADLLCCVPVDARWEERLRTIARKATDAASRSLDALPDDPRTTVFLIEMLRKAKWPGSSAKTLWTEVFEKLVELRDARAIAPLRQMVDKPPYFLGAGFTKWCVEQIAATAEALAKLPVRPDDAETVALAEAQHVSPPRDGWFAVESTSDADKLLAQVWAAPEDLPLRSVIGDALIELGDPWGEFIAFQVQGKRIDRSPLKELLRKHGARFAGPMVHVGARAAMTFEHGFLASCTIGRDMVGRRRWEDVVNAPHWATVKRVVFASGYSPPKWWFEDWLTKSNLTSLREIAIGNLGLSRASPGDPWAMTKVPKRLEWRAEAVLEAFLEGLPLAELERMPVPSNPKARKALQDALGQARD